MQELKNPLLERLERLEGKVFGTDARRVHIDRGRILITTTPYTLGWHREKKAIHLVNYRGITLGQPPPVEGLCAFNGKVLTFQGAPFDMDVEGKAKEYRYLYSANYQFCTPSITNNGKVAVIAVVRNGIIDEIRDGGLVMRRPGSPGTEPLSLNESKDQSASNETWRDRAIRDAERAYFPDRSEV